MNVEITDFQSIAHAELELRGLSVIVGPSNRGKSALLRAIEGALFNRAGDQFARVRPDGTTASNAVVVLRNVHTHDYALTDVAWTKGKANKYVIDGDEYSRVGSEAPQLLQDLGYRDVFIGDEGRKNGERIRPQVGTQFEPLFLLTRPGSFIADVLGVLSRQATVATAQGRCASDLRSVKQKLGIRTTDLYEAQQRVEVLTLPPMTVVQPFLDAVDQFENLRELLRRRSAAVVVPALPEPSGLQFGVNVLSHTDKTAKALQLVAQRAALRQTQQTLPPVTGDEAIRYAKLHAGKAHIRRLQRVLVALPTPASLPFDPAYVAQQQQQARSLVTQRQRALDMVHQAEQAARELATEEEMAKAELDTVLTSLEVCPTCEQLMTVPGVAKELPRKRRKKAEPAAV